MTSSANELQYLRLDSRWTKVIEKSEHPSFVANTTGTPVEFFLSTRDIPTASPESVRAKTYIAGGSIGQICVDNQYLYARADTDDDTVVTVVIGNKPIGDTNIAEQASTMDKLILEVMNLTHRFNESQIGETERAFSYYKFLRYVVDTNQTTDIMLNNLSARVVNLYTKVFAIENFFGENKMTLFNLRSRITALEEAVRKTGFDGLANKLNDALQQIIEINKKLEIFEPLLEDASNLALESITPIKQGLTALNNTIAMLSNKYTELEILKAKDDLVKQYNVSVPEIIPVINNFAKLVIEVSNKLSKDKPLVISTDSLTALEPALPDHSQP